jgi:hypothetical protein
VSISLDWNDLPQDLIESLESLDNQKYHSIENKSKKTAIKSTTRSQIGNTNRNDQVKPYTFNNCHFHYEKKEAESKYEGKIDLNLLPDPHSSVTSPEKKVFVANI